MIAYRPLTTVSRAGSVSFIICRTDELTMPSFIRSSRQSAWPYCSPRRAMSPVVGMR